MNAGALGGQKRVLDSLQVDSVQSTGGCKLIDIGTGNQTQALQEQYMFLTT